MDDRQAPQAPQFGSRFEVAGLRLDPSAAGMRIETVHSLETPGDGWSVRTASGARYHLTPHADRSVAPFLGTPLD